jgi:hypothetical protein
MQGRMLTILGAMSALLLAAPAAVQGAPKVKDPRLVTVDNPFVSCELPLPMGKVEVQSGNTVQFTSDFPIDFVTLKSGKNADVVGATFDLFSGEVTLSKEVGYYDIWVCLGGGGGGET